MWWPFKRKEIKPESGDIVFEHWETDFKNRKDPRFEEEEGDGYVFSILKDCFRLKFTRKDLFSWSICKPYRYRDFVLDLDIEYRGESGYSAAGAVFRYADESTYYYTVVSTTGMFRFDVVFNGSPRTLIPWTKVNSGIDGKFNLTVIAHGTFFAFFINGTWVGEVDDETIDAGYVGFAGQNYDKADEAEYCLTKAVIESGSLSVEEFYDSKVKGDNIPPENRRTLAVRFFDSGQYSAALVQLNKALNGRTPGPEDNLLSARIHNLLGLGEEALKYIDLCLESGGVTEEAVLEKGVILYGLNRFLEAKEFLRGVMDVWKDNPVVWDILGNCEDALGNFNESFSCYAQACRIEPENGIYSLNAARSLEKAGSSSEAFDYYRKAASLFFESGDSADLQYVLACMDRIDPDNPYGLMYKGKLLFEEGRISEAFPLFSKLRSDGVSDASIDFLYALVLADRGNREEALPILKSAAESEPGFYLYWFRYAENLYLTGKDASKELEKALELKNDDPWVLNLAGLIALENGRTAEALEYYSKAFKADDTVPEIRINYSDALYRNGNAEAALSLLDDEDDSRVVNQKGNLYALMGEYEKAAALYYKALKGEPGNRAYRLNYADVLVKLDRIIESEEILAGLLEEKEELVVLGKIAGIAFLRGEFRRAEAAFQRALELDPSDDGIKISYAKMLIARHDYKRAEELLDRIDESSISEDVRRMNEQILDAAYDSYSCSGCGRKWYVPKVIPPVQRIVLRGEPDPQSPAGKCPSCGKVYCVQCAMEYLKDSRFTCMDCGEPLKLSENYLRYLASRYVT